MNIEDNKISKLNERMEQPLPTYKKSQVNRTRFVGNEPVLKTLLDDEYSIFDKSEKMNNSRKIQKCQEKSNLYKSKFTEIKNLEINQNTNNLSKNSSEDSPSENYFKSCNSNRYINRMKENDCETNKMPNISKDEENEKIENSKNINLVQDENKDCLTSLKRVKRDNSEYSESDSCQDINETDINKKKITDYFKSAPITNKITYEEYTERKIDFSSSQIIVDDKSNPVNVFEREKTETIMDVIIREKDREIQSIFTKLKQSEESFENYRQKSKLIISKIFVELESYKRFEKKNFINNEKARVGEYVPYREGSKFRDVWIDGYELKNLKNELIKIISKREALESTRKKHKKKNTKIINDEKSNNIQDFGSGLVSSYTGNFAAALLTMNYMPRDNSEIKNKNNHIGNIYGYGINNEGSDNSNQIPGVGERTYEETREQIGAQIVHLVKEENYLKEKIENLEKEKEKYIRVAKKLFEEDNCRFGKIVGSESFNRWPLLNNRYQLISLLGKGGFSEVYQAFDCDELREVACKIHQLNTSWSENQKSNYIKHALRENQVHKILSHPNIVTHYDSVEIDSNSFCTILEFCSGPDLSSLLKKYKVLSEKDSKSIIKQILSALKFLNENGRKIIHYDLKPQNILFNDGMIKISDFGLCKVMGGDETRLELTSQGVGTYWYLPPECFSHDYPKISPKVDIWSIGVIFYEMLYGVKPFGHEMSQERILKEGIMLKAYSFEFPAKPAVSTEIKDFIRKCLEYNQELRYNVFEAWNAFNK